MNQFVQRWQLHGKFNRKLSAVTWLDLTGIRRICLFQLVRSGVNSHGKAGIKLAE